MPVTTLFTTVTVSGVLQLSDDDSTSIAKLGERKRKEENIANTSRWFLSAQTGAMAEKGSA